MDKKDYERQANEQREHERLIDVYAAAALTGIIARIEPNNDLHDRVFTDTDLGPLAFRIAGEMVAIRKRWLDGQYD